ncbi:hypothetical protein HBH70_031870 [Parastagonospora nodorum]|nr:hypothetical protein HBH70_031870 [Parastagonospora nodorum]
MLATTSLRLARYRLLASESQNTELTAHDTMRLPIAVREGCLLRFWCRQEEAVEPTPSLRLWRQTSSESLKRGAKRKPSSSCPTSSTQISTESLGLSVHLSCKAAPGFEVRPGFTSQVSRWSPTCDSGSFEWGWDPTPPSGKLRGGRSDRPVTGVWRGSSTVCV